MLGKNQFYQLFEYGFDPVTGKTTAKTDFGRKQIRLNKEFALMDPKVKNKAKLIRKLMGQVTFAEAERKMRRELLARISKSEKREMTYAENAKKSFKQYIAMRNT